MKKVLIFGIILAVIGVGLLATSIFFGTKTFFNESPADILKERNEDSDNDGLTNKEEDELGTLKDKADSDMDGLLDGEEIKKYNTNPNNEDTDRDGYDDKEEIDGGFDPTKRAR